MRLRIYLDTQDYINLYQNRNSKQEMIYQFLCSKIDEGKIEIGFSYVIISEFLTNYDKEYKEDRLKRIQLIKRLCKRNCFLFMNRIGKEKEVFSNIGDWTPKVEALENIEQQIKFISKRIQIFITESKEGN